MSDKPDLSTPQMLPLDALLPSDSPRVEGEDEKHVKALAQSDVVLPPVIVHRSTMRIVDGMHRLRAAALRGENLIAVQFFGGDEAEAFVLAVELNAEHGLPLSQADRSSAAKRIISIRPQWSDRRIGAVTGLAASSVAALRAHSTDQIEQSKRRVGRDGRSRPLNPAEGRKRASRLLAVKPSSTLKEVAEGSGLSIATAKDVRDRVRAGKDPLPPRLRNTEAKRERASTEQASSEGQRHAPPPQQSSAGLDSALQRMLRDPAMRTEAGRDVLRLLRSHVIGDESKWRRMAAGVPEYRAAAVAQAARVCAERWLRLAKELEAGNRHMPQQ
ncbi:ParB/RepB/Spo0J family partition protein [Streptomyces sp. NPDC021093]|uniref:ParB/RepB/Spo0J family partition protein n=1 Tax=Streptomyces sp. NPDC021093 TaxID=3365112 RepID=UPI00378F63AB